MNLTRFGSFHLLSRFLPRAHATAPAETDQASAPLVVSLQMNGTFELEQSLGCQIQCIRGSIWITHLGDGRDLVVEAGSSFTGDREAPMFIQALVSAQFSVAMLQPLELTRSLGRPAASQHP